MSAQHTPGPWEAIEWKCRAATSVVVVRDGQMVQIAECSGFGRMSDECIADASLIAAAPEAPAQASAVDERDRKDAERYRHIVKEGDGRIYTDPHGIIIWNFPKNKKGVCDSAIDAHMKYRAALAKKGGAQ